MKKDIEIKNGKNVKIHTVYKTADGLKVPSVTTVLSVLNKGNALIHWAWDLGCKGIDYRTFRDDKASIGTCVHQMILAHLKGEEVDTSDYTEKQVDLAETCFLKYLEWEKGKDIKPILLETPLVSETYQYGGTIDNLCFLDGKETLIDYKTSKGIYDENFMQVAAYEHLIFETQKIIVSDLLILRIGRDETEGFEERRLDNINRYFEIFKHCLEIYRLKKE